MFIILLKSQNSNFVLNSSFDIIIFTGKPDKFQFELSSFAGLFIHANVNTSHTFIVFLILNSWETDLQMSIDFLLNPIL